jgi:nucleoside-diphosphate-sugar epimerase
MVNRILAAAGLPPVTATISPRAAMFAARLCEGVWSTFRLAGEPPITRFVASELSTAHWFDISAARRDLGYVPEVSIEEGLQRLRGWLRRQ